MSVLDRVGALGPLRGRDRRDRDRRTVARSRLALTAQLATAITAVVALVGGIAYLVTTERQNAQIEAMLGYTLRQDHTGAVDPCTWLFVAHDGTVTGADQAPAGLPDRTDLRTVATTGIPIARTVHVDGTVYGLRTARDGTGVRQAAFDERYQVSDAHHLAWALVVAELVGLAIAVLVGRLLACRAIRPLDEALTRQRQFVADASHELRAPLTRLHTRTQLLLDRPGPPLPEHLADELHRIADSSRELNEIVEDLLRSARLSASRPAGERVDVRAVAASVAGAEAPRAALAGVRVQTGGDPGTVLGVPSALRRMISALVDNAVRHARTSVRVTTARDERTVEIAVTDDGDGPPDGDGRLLFERFHRGPGAGSGRSGLGLALVREVVLAHGGTVTVGRGSEGGSRFTVRLPAAPPVPRPGPRPRS